MNHRLIARGGHALKKQLTVAVLATSLLSGCMVGPKSQQLDLRNEAYATELEQYFRDYLVTRYPERPAKAWHRSYESEQAFLESVAPNRERYRLMISPPDLKPAGPLAR